MIKSAFFIKTIISFGFLSLLLSDALASNTSSNHITLYTHALELKPIPSSFQLAKSTFLPDRQLAKSTFLPDRFDDLGLSNYNTLDSNYNSVNCDMYPLSSCPAGTRCETCPFNAKKFRMLSCNDPYILSNGTCVCPTATPLTYANDRCTKYCGSTCIAKTCSPSANQSGCTNGTQSCDNGCGANTRQCCVACAHKVTSKPSYSSYTYASCYDGSTKQIQTGWTCNSGYHQKDSTCEKDCITNNCSGYSLTSCPANANCTPCTITATNCTTSGTKYKIDSCADGYMVSGNTCVEKSIRDCAALQAALQNATTGETVSMDADITCSSGLFNVSNITLNGNGHTLTFTASSTGAYGIYFKEGVIFNLTIKEGVIKAPSLKNVNAYLNNTHKIKQDTIDVGQIEGNNNFVFSGGNGSGLATDNLIIKEGANVNINFIDESPHVNCSSTDCQMTIEKGATVNIDTAMYGIQGLYNLQVSGTLNVITKSKGATALRDVSNINLSEGANLNITTQGDNSLGIGKRSGWLTMNLSTNSHAQITTEGDNSTTIAGNPLWTIAGTLDLTTLGENSYFLSIFSASLNPRLTLEESGTFNITAQGYNTSMSGKFETVTQYGNININGNGDVFGRLAINEYYMYGGKTQIHTSATALNINQLNMSGGEINIESVGNSNSANNASSIFRASGISLSGESKIFIENKAERSPAVVMDFQKLFLTDSTQISTINNGTGPTLQSYSYAASSYQISITGDSILNVFSKNKEETLNRLQQITLANNAQFNIKTSAAISTGPLNINNNAQFNMICDRERSLGCFERANAYISYNYNIADNGQFNIKTEGNDSQCFPSITLFPTSANAKIRLMCNKNNMTIMGSSAKVTAFPNTVYETSIGKYTGVSGKVVSVTYGIQDLEGFTRDANAKLTQMPDEFNKIFSEGIFAQ